MKMGVEFSAFINRFDIADAIALIEIFSLSEDAMKSFDSSSLSLSGEPDESDTISVSS
ncbi:hypothetical protein GCM10007938_31560 [Vibrio zhanjiangensis]|uniref:Uncharacterized protein n=1 Tax=Vibrio zhanjiangensis TaxID=1046128 RepID=A0ABQ6F2C7_9VIBR|nr:hypothetical protein GCM10007938_31560 [Vibrio zhanjiangensis]